MVLRQPNLEFSGSILGEFHREAPLLRGFDGPFPSINGRYGPVHLNAGRQTIVHQVASQPQGVFSVPGGGPAYEDVVFHNKSRDEVETRQALERKGFSRKGLLVS